MSKNLLIKIIFSSLLAAVLFIGTSFIPRHGEAINSVTAGPPMTYRDSRGLPFIFLQRSVGDGQCLIKYRGNCDFQTQSDLDRISNHQLNYWWIVIDAVFWLILSFAVVFLGVSRLKHVCLAKPGGSRA